MAFMGRRQVLAATGGLLAMGAPGGAALASPKAKVGDPAPRFSVYLFGGGQVTSEELLGKVVILNYWATWCAPCKREMPLMDSYLRNNPLAASDLKIFAVGSLESPDPILLRPLAKALAFPLVTGLKGWGYGVLEGVPTNYVIDRAGVMRYAKATAFTAESLDAVVAPLLAEPAPARSAKT